MKYLLILLLTGCGLAAPKVQTVNIPVIQPCILFAPVKPSLISDAELLKMIDGNFVTALHIDRLKRQSYETELEAVIKACVADVQIQ